MAKLHSIQFDGKQVLVITENYAIAEGKKKIKYLANYTLSTYTIPGNKTKEITAGVAGKAIKSATFFTKPNNEIVFAAYYCNDMNAEYTNGLSLNIIDIEKGSVVNTATSEMSLQSLKILKDGDKDGAFGLPDDFAMSYFVANPQTGGLLMISENISNGSVSRTLFNGNPAAGFVGNSTNSAVYYRAESIFVTSIGTKGEIVWMNRLPKSQSETISASNLGGAATAMAAAKLMDYPLYSSFTYVPSASGLHFIFNDHAENAGIMGPTVQLEVYGTKFKEAVVYDVKMDYKTGKFTRKAISSTSEETGIMMTKSAFVKDNTIYVASKKDKGLFGKNSFSVSKIIVK